jgi:hypothetical protein
MSAPFKREINVVFLMGAGGTGLFKKQENTCK